MPPGARLAACCFALATVALGKQQAHAPALAKVKRDAAASPYFLTSERDGASVIEYRQRKRLSGQGTQYVNSVLPLPEHCAATRSCSVVAVETLMDRADLVHHLVIQQPNSARSCKTGRGGVRFKGVVVLHTKLMWRAPVDSSWYPGTPCVLMQAHYDNPNGSTTVDDSGVRLHISSRPMSGNRKRVGRRRIMGLRLVAASLQRRCSVVAASNQGIVSRFPTPGLGLAPLSHGQSDST
mmetsp:Transcript_35068/g.108643  ORF Transcript_35068/g.108643 Transcript_35068/m.108643 type:complete len:238 (-) Transcript_35068:410-1123(-)